MPRQYDIHIAFVASIQQNPKGYQYLRTADFIRKLNAHNWIECYQTDFVDKTPDFSENRY